MKYRLVTAALVIVAPTFAFSQASKSPTGKTEAESVKKELEAVYAQPDEAIKKNGFGAFVATFAPDCSVHLLDGQTFDRLIAEQVERFIKNDMKQTLAVERSTSSIDDLKVTGNEAVVTLTHEALRTLTDAEDKPHTIKNRVVHQETRVRTREGWKIRRSEETKQA